MVVVKAAFNCVGRDLRVIIVERRRSARYLCIFIKLGQALNLSHSTQTDDVMRKLRYSKLRSTGIYLNNIEILDGSLGLVVREIDGFDS